MKVTLKLLIIVIKLLNNSMHSTIYQSNHGPVSHFFHVWHRFRQFLGQGPECLIQSHFLNTICLWSKVRARDRWCTRVSPLSLSNAGPSNKPGTDRGKHSYRSIDTS